MILLSDYPHFVKDSDGADNRSNFSVFTAILNAKCRKEICLPPTEQILLQSC